MKFLLEPSQFRNNKFVCMSKMTDQESHPNTQSRLFERFYRVDKARSREVGGTGLGLAIVKHIVQSHGGSVAIKSSAGQGSEFICCFPSRGP